MHPCTLVFSRLGHLVLNYMQNNATTKKIIPNAALFVFGGKWGRSFDENRFWEKHAC